MFGADSRVRNFETSELKVNDADGNPINIAAIVVWQVADTAVRHIAGQYPYDSHGDDQLSLRDNADEITERLATEIGERVIAAGVRVIESRLTHLAYAPEIAQAMLQRQQAGAIIAARSRIVEGAVSMVEDALQRLEAESIVTLDDERRAAMVSNLLVVLCSDSRATPVVNAGSLYS
jgi:hypothetical protein